MTTMRSLDVDPVRSAVDAAIGQGRIAVACSGGADSLALAHATIAAAGADRVVVLTIDHGLVPSSAEVCARVVAWAQAQGAVAASLRVQVNDRASLEAAAREARYAALAQLADAHAVATVFTAHTARDQAETVLMRILRGTGPAGLAAIPAARDRYVRPLLGVSRAAIDAYVATHALPVWDDPMNADPALLRTRIRQTILPALREENPQLDVALIRLADSAAEWLAVIDERARPLLADTLDCERLAREPAAVRKRVLALWLEAAGVDYAAPHLDALDALVCRPSAGQALLDLPAHRVVRSYATLALATPHVATALRAPAGYTLRTWQAGDRMRPARLAGRSRKLSDLFIDAKVPRDQRATARVVVDGDGVIVWAEHLGLAFAQSTVVVPTAADGPAE